MKLSFSNIAWDASQDEEMYQFLMEQGFFGLEIAPTRIFPEQPYEHLTEAKDFVKMLKERYHLHISSMQSIWFGKNENIFGSGGERQTLIEYTKKAVDFAASCECRNLVFGCPKNRNIPDGASYETAYDFFKEIAAYAINHGTVIAIEPNPPIYGTNFINRTAEACSFAREVPGLKLNLDTGTIIENSENLKIIADHLSLVNHVHISEPYLEKVKERDLHIELSKILSAINYDQYVSVEMKNLGDIEAVKQAAEYLRRIFDEI